MTALAKEHCSGDGSRRIHWEPPRRAIYEGTGRRPRPDPLQLVQRMGWARVGSHGSDGRGRRRTGDIREIKSVARGTHRVDYVRHLAAHIVIPDSYLKPRDFIATNVEVSLNVAQAALGAGVRHVIHISTSVVYGSA